ncbi:MAG TPA: hypothetical protein VK059_10070, partial [Nocardioidaceae bacterium]|nr:hypothetical protein [Nocardioidaceae bacterium]
MSIAKPTIPFYAAVGAGDALVEKVRTTDPAQFKAPKLKAPHVKAPQLSDVTELPAQLKALPEHLRELQEQAQSFATDTLGQLTTAYTDFAKRGETVVEDARKRGETVVEDARKRGESVVDDVRKRDVIAEVKGAVSKLKGAARLNAGAPAAETTSASQAKQAESTPTEKSTST